MNRTKTATWVKLMAGTAALTLTLAACADDERGRPRRRRLAQREHLRAEPATGGDGTLTIGQLLPQTGSLAFLGPPEFAGVDLAIQDINAAGGVQRCRRRRRQGRLG